MQIRINSALKSQPDLPGTYESKGFQDGNRFYRAMQNLEKQDLGEGWAIEPGNTDGGNYRLSLTLNGLQAAVFDENWTGAGAPASPHVHLHPFISQDLALSKLDAALEIGIKAADRVWDVKSDPVAEEVADPFEAEEPEVQQEPSYG